MRSTECPSSLTLKMSSVFCMLDRPSLPDSQVRGWCASIKSHLYMSQTSENGKILLPHSHCLDSSILPPSTSMQDTYTALYTSKVTYSLFPCTAHADTADQGLVIGCAS